MMPGMARREAGTDNRAMSNRSMAQNEWQRRIRRALGRSIVRANTGAGDVASDSEAIADEMASIPLDLWAQKQGYTKLQTNLMQL
jgi:hypothetical protein